MRIVWCIEKLFTFSICLAALVLAFWKIWNCRSVVCDVKNAWNKCFVIRSMHVVFQFAYKCMQFIKIMNEKKLPYLVFTIVFFADSSRCNSAYITDRGAYNRSHYGLKNFNKYERHPINKWHWHRCVNFYNVEKSEVPYTFCWGIYRWVKAACFIAIWLILTSL